MRRQHSQDDMRGRERSHDEVTHTQPDVLPGTNADEVQAPRVRVEWLVVVGGIAVLAAAGIALGANSWTSVGNPVFLGRKDGLPGSHSEDGATGTTYLQPTTPTASVNPTAMKFGSTVTWTSNQQLAASSFTPSITASIACTNQSYCPGSAGADN
jgi:hypothetical protein